MIFKDILPTRVSDAIEHGRQLGHDFRTAIIEPRLARWKDLWTDDSQKAYSEVLHELNRARVFSLWLPRILGGGGLLPLSYLAWSEEVAKSSLGIANVVGAHYVALSLVSASDDLRLLSQFVQEIRAGEEEEQPCVLAAAVTEPDAGTDLEDLALFPKAQVRTSAKRVAGGFRLDGAKQFISNAVYARWLVVTAFEDTRMPHNSVVMLVVPTSSPGVSIGKPERKMGQNLCPASPIFFDKCFVPESRTAFERNQFSSVKEYQVCSENLLYDVLTFSRMGVAVMALGAFEAAFERLMKYSRQEGETEPLWFEQEWFQRILAQLRGELEANQRLSWSMAIEYSCSGPHKDLYTKGFQAADHLPLNHLLRPLLTKALRQSLRQKRLRLFTRTEREQWSGRASIAKSRSTDAAMSCLETAIGMMGPACLERGHFLEGLLRDTKLLQIYEGANMVNELNTFNLLLAAQTPAFFPYSDAVAKRVQDGNSI